MNQEDKVSNIEKELSLLRENYQSDRKFFVVTVPFLFVVVVTLIYFFGIKTSNDLVEIVHTIINKYVKNELEISVGKAVPKAVESGIKKIGAENFLMDAKESAIKAAEIKGEIDNWYSEIQKKDGPLVFLPANKTRFLDNARPFGRYKPNGGEYIENVSNHVPKVAKGVILNVTVYPDRLHEVSSFVCADSLGKFFVSDSKHDAQRQQGISTTRTHEIVHAPSTNSSSRREEVNFPVGGIVFCPLMSGGKVQIENCISYI